MGLAIAIFSIIAWKLHFCNKKSMKLDKSMKLHGFLLLWKILESLVILCYNITLHYTYTSKNDKTGETYRNSTVHFDWLIY
jgi:hypothetical protein